MILSKGLVAMNRGDKLAAHKIPFARFVVFFKNLFVIISSIFKIL